MPTKFKLLAGLNTAMLLLFSLGIFAQTTTITGRIVSESDQKPVAGATVQVKGSKTSALTAVDGTFTITSAKAVSSLVVSNIGFATRTIPVSGSSVGDVVLSISTTTLNDVIVTGYSSQRKKDITGAVAIVNVGSFKSVPGGNANDLLQGQAAGVTVISAGVPGGYANVRVRGITSIGNSDPLYIIDGVQIPDGYSQINVNDIESLQILKDAASCAIYGVRGSNGVVIVTTKKGKTGKPKIQYDGYIGTQQPLSGNVFDIATPQESGNALYKQFANSGLAFNATNFKNSQYGYGPTPVLYDYLTPINTNAGGPNTDPSTYALYSNEITKTNKTGTDWFHAIFSPAPIQSHTIAASGANDKSSYYFSVGYFDQQGTMMNTFLKRYSTRVNTVFNVKDNIRIGENMYFLYKQSPGFPGSSNQNEGNAISMTYRMSPLIPVYDVVGNYAGTQVKGLGNPQNPVATLARSANNVNNTWMIYGNAFAEVDFLKHFTVRTSFGGEYANNYNYNFSYTSYENTENNTNPNQFAESDLYGSNWTWTNTLTYNNKFGESNLKVLVGTEAVNNYVRGFGATRGNYYITNPNNLTVDPNLWTLGFGSPSTQTNYSTLNGQFLPVQSTIYSLFAKADYSYKDRYLLSGTIRRDQSSIFAPGNNTGYFPSFSAGWRLSEEDFMKSTTWLQDLKLRGGWGKLGSLSNARTTNQFTLYGQAAANSSYDIGGTSNSAQLGSYNSQTGGPGTTWEKDAITDIGVDASFLGHFDLTLDWYRKYVTGLLFQPGILQTAGGSSAPYQNIGDITNTGWDGSITYHGGTNSGWKYSATVIYGSYVNEVKSLGNNKYVDETSTGSNRFGAFSRLQPGHAVGAFYGYKVVGLFQNATDAAKSNQPDAAVGRFKYADINGDGKITDSDRTFIGNPNPKFTLGFNLNVSYKAFDLTAFFYGSFGNDIANYVKYWTDFPQVFDAAVSKRAALQSFGLPGANGKTPILERSANFSNTTVFNSYYMESGSYFRCKQLQLGYTLPNSILSKAGIDHLRLYVQVANLFTITKYDGLDPQLQTSDPNNNSNFGIDFGNYPANERSYNVGVQLSF